MSNGSSSGQTPRRWWALGSVAAILVVGGLVLPRLNVAAESAVAAARSPAPSAPAATPAAAPDQIAAREPSAYRELDLPGPAPRSGAASGEAAASAADPALDCMVVPYESVAIGSPVVGLIERIHVQRSDRVQAGQVLVELESGVERANVDVARARAVMEGEERARMATAGFEGRKDLRTRELFERQVVPLGQQDEMETAAEIARRQLQQSQEERRLASLQLTQAEEVLRRRTIRSPVSGVVVERLMAPGERVDEQTILRVVQIDPLRVEVTLPSAMFGRVHPGTRAAVEPELPGDQSWVAAVTMVDGVIDAASGTFVAYLELANPDLSIPSGLHCRVRFLQD
jgi:RND family efflux transporter MFP subunit